MKQILFKVLKLFLGMFVLLFLCLLGVYWYISNNWKRHYTEDEMMAFANEINKAPKLSNTFYGIYDKLHNNDRHKSITHIYASSLWNEMILKRQQRQTSWHVRSARYFPLKKSMKEYAHFKLAWGLEKFTTPEKCFDCVLYEENLQLSRIDTTIKDIRFLYDTTEIIKYMVLLKRPYFYRLHPEKLNQQIAKLKIKLNKRNE